MDLDKVAHDEPPNQDLRCLQIQLLSSLCLKIQVNCAGAQFALNIIDSA